MDLRISYGSEWIVNFVITEALHRYPTEITMTGLTTLNFVKSITLLGGYQLHLNIHSVATDSRYARANAARYALTPACLVDSVRGYLSLPNTHHTDDGIYRIEEQSL